jgi:hypothetical protein
MGEDEAMRTASEMLQVFCGKKKEEGGDVFAGWEFQRRYETSREAWV